MTAASPASERRRPRPGSLERPVNGRLYRGVWLLVALPVLLLLAFSVSRPAALNGQGLTAGVQRRRRRRRSPVTSPTASPTASPARAARSGRRAGSREQLAPYGFDVTARDVHGHDPRPQDDAREPRRGEGRALAARDRRHGAPRRQRHGRGLNDNASGTGALIELARSYAPIRTSQLSSLPYSIAFVSTDGAEEGALGAAHFAAKASHTPERRRRDQSRLDRRQGQSTARVRRRHAAFAGAGPARDDAEGAQQGIRRDSGPTRQPSTSSSASRSRSARTSRRRS